MPHALITTYLTRGLYKGEQRISNVFQVPRFTPFTIAMTVTSFTLQPLTIDDAPIIGKIGKAAFENDRHTMMKTKGSYDHEDTAQEPIGYYLTLPQKVQCIKAVDNASGNILGYVCWGFRGYTRENVPTLAGQGVGQEKFKTQEEAPKALEPETKASETSEGEESKAEKDKDDHIKRLTAITDADMQNWMAKLMPEGTKCMFIVTLSVDPNYVSHGVGSALMDWGTGYADKDGVFCWVHASDGSHVFYAKHGFEKVGELTVDLDEFATAPAPDNDGKWGQYTFRYMKRLPRTEE